MQRTRTTYNFSPELAALLEALLRQSHVARSDATRVNNNISVKVDAERKLKQANKRIANEHTAKHFAKKEADRDREAKRAALESLNKLNSILGIPLLNIEYGPQATNQGTIQDGWQAKIDKAYSDYGMSNALGQMTNVSDAWRATPSFGRFVGKDVPTSMIVAGGLATNPVGTALGFGTGYLGGQVGGVVGSKYFNNEEAGEIIGSFAGFPFGYKLGRPLTYALEALPNFSRNYRLSRTINNTVDDGVQLKEAFTPVTRQFVHPSEAVRKAYTAPNLEGLEMTTAEPLMNRSAVGKVPEGAKIVGEFKGEPLIEINGKKYLLSKYNELHGGAPDLGYDPKVIAEEAKKDFTGPLARIIDNSEVLTSLADKIKRGEATTEFSRNKGTLVDPNARDVLAGELADIKRGKQKRGVALVNTMPTNITTTGQETYAGRGNFGLGSFSVTNHPGAVRAYGAIDYPKLILHIKDSKMLTDNEKNSLYSYLKRMKELDKDPLSRMTENTDAKIKLNPEEDIEYLNLISLVNKLIPGTFEYGGLNRHILYQALKEPQIINVSSKSDKFGVSSRNVARELLPLTDFLGHRLMTFNPKYNPNKSTSVELVHGGYVGNILEAERLIGGYKYKNKFGNWEKEPGWNLTPSILLNLMGLLRGTNGKFYVRGVGPNGVPGAIDMVTLQAPNGGIPGFKLGNKLNYYKHV